MLIIKSIIFSFFNIRQGMLAVIRFLFPLNLFLGAFLLFSIQPMAAKVLLPLYGGAPEIWTVCMLFFQGILLMAYAYISLFPLIRKVRMWSLLHLSLISCSLFVIPIFFHPTLLSPQPQFNILFNLLLQLGLPLLVVGSSAPLLQFLYSQTTNKGSSDPYFLYSASNLGSLIALLSYPWLIEQFIGLDKQFQIWNILYLIYISLLLSIFFLFNYTPLPPSTVKNKPWPWRSMMMWCSLSFIPCSLMLGVSLYITTDVSATPLFWIIPLVLYLLSFILTFTNKPLISPAWIKRNVLLFIVFVILSFILGNNHMALQSTVLHLAGFFMLALLCHNELYNRRPATQELTLFYFCLALGGVAAGIANGIIAPRLFNQIFEYPITILLSFFVIPVEQSKTKLWKAPIVLGLLILSYYLPEFKIDAHISSAAINIIDMGILFVAAVIAFIGYKNKYDLILSVGFILFFTFLPKVDWQVLTQQRNFYGVKRVIKKEQLHVLINQSTVHGVQNMANKSSRGGSSYYTPVKEVIHVMQKSSNTLTSTIIGLGTGTALCQYNSNDKVTMIEIDPQVIDIAKNKSLFTYMHDCLPNITLLNADGRIAMGTLKNASQDVIVLDAFSSDAIPIHLMTLEAFTLYKQKLTANGVILINLSNRYLNLLPVVNSLGRSLDMMVFYNNHKGNAKEQQLDSQWALLTTNEQLTAQIIALKWRFLASNQQRLWTDNYSNIIPLLKFN